MTDTAAAAPPSGSRARSPRLPNRSFAEVDGAPIHYLSWNARRYAQARPAVRARLSRARALVEFHRAVLSQPLRVVVDRLRRAWATAAAAREYTPLELRRATSSACSSTRGSSKPTLVGHSFGGGRVARACAEFPERVERAVIIDSHMRLTDEKRSTRAVRDAARRRVYPTLRSGARAVSAGAAGEPRGAVHPRLRRRGTR